MNTWGFRFKFLIPRGKRINEESPSLEIYLPSEGKGVLLKSIDNNGIKDSDNLVISGSGFRSKEGAEACGKRIKNSILICGPILRMGFDVGKDKASFFLGEDFKIRGKELGYQLIDDVHGLCFFQECLKVRVCGGGASVIMGFPSKKFIEEFKNVYKTNQNLNDKQTLSLELYNMSYFETSQRARFITLISAIECLCDRERRSDNAFKHIESLAEMTRKSNLATNEKKSFLNNISNLKTESISESCKKLVKTCLGVEYEAEFNKYYKIRSQMSHKGTPGKGINIISEISSLEAFTSKLFIALIFGNSVEESNVCWNFQKHTMERKFVE